jgi:flagellar hook-basal body complex protein FliE
MDTNALSASIAYLNALKRATQEPGGASEAAPAAAGAGPSFSELLQGVAEDVVDNSHKAETASLQATVKQAELVDVISAVSNAEMALESVVAVRDRVVQAYQEILRMPI